MIKDMLITIDDGINFEYLTLSQNRLNLLTAELISSLAKQDYSKVILLNNKIKIILDTYKISC
jgi:hypothetical protein